jgi:hypothetical protein
MNSFFPARKDDDDDPEALDPRAHPVAPPRMAGAVKILVGAEAVALAAPFVPPARSVAVAPVVPAAKAVAPVVPAAKAVATVAAISDSKVIAAAPATSAKVEEIHVVEPLPERAYRAGALEELRGRRLQLSPLQRAAQRAAQMGERLAANSE